MSRVVTKDCPRCGRHAILDALSRHDNKTMVCAACGMDEALKAFAGKPMPYSEWYINKQ